MKLAAAISMALVVVALIGLQPLVAADSAREMGNCTNLLKAISPCLPYMDSATTSSLSASAPSRICCQSFFDLESKEECLCYLVRNATFLEVTLDFKRISSLIDFCHVNDTGTKKRSSADLQELCYEEHKKAAFIFAIMAFLVSSLMAIYTILHHTVVPPKVPIFSITNMLSFMLVTWYGIITDSKKIAILNGIRAGFEFGKILSYTYHNSRLWKPTFGSLAASFYGFAVFFGLSQLALEGTKRELFFAWSSTSLSVIVLFVPLFTLREELRQQQWIACFTALAEGTANVFWMVNGVEMIDLPTFVTAFVGMVTNFTAAEYLATDGLIFAGSDDDGFFPYFSYFLQLVRELFSQAVV